MSAELITDIGELTTVDPEERVLQDAAVVIEGDRIAWIGPAAQAPAADTVTSAEGRALLPGWVDSHTHLVFAGDRSAEFEARMAGQSYAAGGINVTTEATRAASDAQLRELVTARVQDAVRGGTTYLETKTGYGLSVDEEIRQARLLAELRTEGVVDQVTFLGAHLVPPGGDADAYVRDVVGPMLEGVREHVQWADVFCERGAFTQEQSRTVLQACAEAGLGLRVHGNQLGEGPGVALAVELGAASVDHVNHLTPDDVATLAQSWSGWERGGQSAPGTVATCLPACDLSTREPLAPGRELLDAGVQIALASNCNPGTSYTSSMNFCVGTAVLQMHLSLAEAVGAATFGGALALRAQDEVGSIEVGKRADLHLLDAPAAIHLAYRPGMPLTHAVWRAGRRVV
ncbi:imidazolonepropionase [Micrococcus terreus]|uniref:imidazolonepropionase n=1 Tax=Micrococcus terreus TaxID=574650 RepID=UPI00254BA52E|nr:imidazolonepropionase [Micrococcus terreus]MDK7700824.1 imidazolonepropionase [Micrococcus terreus]WOO97209.1 imidazolonepropionase [Micrococcus terreus]